MQQFVIDSDKLDQWLRSFFIDDGGQVYLPAGAYGDETEAVLCLIHDNVPYVRDGGHVYAPASWLVRQHPRYAYAIDTIVASIARRLREGAAA